MLSSLENAEEVLQILERFTKQKSKDIPPELDEYLNYVAKTGDTVYRWPTVQYLFHEKLSRVIKEFHDTTASIEDLPQCPNVDQFNYETMKTTLLERMDHFQAAPFTVQRLCELLTDPKKHYSRLDKFMRALEKNILVVSTVEPGRIKPVVDENGDPLAQLNGDISDINNDVDMDKDAVKTSNGTHDSSTAAVDKKIEEAATSSSAAATESKDEPAKSEEAVSAVEAKVDAENKSDENKKTETIEKVDSKETATEEPAKAAAEAEVPEKPVADENIETKAQSSDAVEDKKEPAAEEDVPMEAEKVEESAVPISVIEEPAAEKVVEAKESATETDATSESKEVTTIAEEAKAETQVNSSIEESKLDESLAKEAKEPEKPPTPKRLRENEPETNSEANETEESVVNPKKIKLDDETEGEKVAEESKVEAQPETETVVSEEIANKEATPAEAADVELPKESDILETVADLIDEQIKGDVDAAVSEGVEVAKIAEEIPNVDAAVEAIVEKTVAELPAVEELPSVAKELVTEAVAELSDITPDEALKELVSSDILADAVPETVQAETQNEDKMVDEPATAVADVPITNPDEMAVEETAAASAPEAATEASDAMEAAPIKPDDEQMDVDESNSVDAMDL